MNKEDVLGAFLLVNNPIVLSEEETKDVQKAIKQLQQENKQLKYNWNKLKEYLNYKSERAVGEDEYVYDEIYNEMRELEQGSDSNE